MTKQKRIQLLCRFLGLSTTLACGYFLVTGNVVERIVASPVLLLGLLLLFIPPPSWSDDKKLANISLLVGILGTAFVPLGLFQLPEFAEFCVGPGSHADIQALQELRIAPWWKDDSAEFTLQDGIYYARASSKAYKWAGYYVRVPACDYTVELDAKLIGPLVPDPSPGQGWGYGVGLCSFLHSPEPQGLSWQYGVYQSSTGPVAALYPRILPQADTPSEDERNVSRITALDGQWHHWTLIIHQEKVAAYFDNDLQLQPEPATGNFPYPPSCLGSGFLIRVWGGQAEFRNIEFR